MSYHRTRDDGLLYANRMYMFYIYIYICILDMELIWVNAYLESLGDLLVFWHCGVISPLCPPPPQTHATTHTYTQKEGVPMSSYILSVVRTCWWRQCGTSIGHWRHNHCHENCLGPMRLTQKYDHRPLWFCRWGLKYKKFVILLSSLLIHFWLYHFSLIPALTNHILWHFISRIPDHALNMSAKNNIWNLIKYDNHNSYFNQLG